MKYAFAKGVVLVAAAADQLIEEQGDPANNVLEPTGTGPDINFNNGPSVTSADVDATRTGFAGDADLARRARQLLRHRRSGPPVEPEKTPEQGYHFMTDMTDQAIKWTRRRKR